MKGLALGGFMGVGKSTIGKNIAHHVGVPFYDTDVMVEDISKMSISGLFASQGEESFRCYEATVVRSLKDSRDIVVALGGGTLHHHNNFDLVNDNFVLIVLEASFDFLKPRFGNRPLRSTASILYKTRKNLFSQANNIVRVENRSISQISEDCIQIWKDAA